jgi:hypothetical protein
MNYIIDAIRIIFNRLGTYALFLLVTFVPFSFGAFERLEEVKSIPSFIYSILISGACLFFLAGIYYLFIMNEKQNYLVILYQASKKYFVRILSVIIFVGLVVALLVFLFTFPTKALLNTVYSFEQAENFLAFNLMRNIITLIVSIYFVYSIPFIYSHDLKYRDAISISYKFLKSNMKISRPIIILLSLSIGINILFRQFAIVYEYNSIGYWAVMSISNFIVKSINLLVFLASVLLLEDNFNSDLIKHSI